MKTEFRNYHYIVECTHKNLILGVPLTCIVEYHGLVAQVKAKIPPNAKEIKNVKDIDYVLQPLENVCKILLQTFYSSRNKCQFYDLSEEYGSNGELPLIYVDNLFEYLP